MLVESKTENVNIYIAITNCTKNPKFEKPLNIAKSQIFYEIICDCSIYGSLTINLTEYY